MITSSSNASVKNIITLQKKGKARREQDVYVIEGIKMFSEVPKEKLVQVFASEGFLSQPENEQRLQGLLGEKDCSCETVSDKVFKEMTDTQTPQGILAVVKQNHYVLEEMFPAEQAAQIMVLEDMQDPGNLGTILRAGEGAGITGVIMSKGTVDIYNPKVIRSTMGSVYRVPFLYTDCLDDTLQEVKKCCTVYAAHLHGQYDYDKADYTKPTAMLIGNEANGLSDEISAMADVWIKIPMAGKVESLNAAVAASVLMFEAFRQRR